MRRDTIRIGDDRFVLAHGQSVDDVKAATISAVRSNGGLVDLVVFGSKEVSVLVSPGVAVIFTSELIEADDQDSRDTGDVDAPFETMNDFEYM